jgi:hypothetical protein
MRCCCSVITQYVMLIPSVVLKTIKLSDNLNESCDAVCANYSPGWTCDVDELHTTVSNKEPFLAAQNAVLDCDFPDGDCDDERDVTESGKNYLYFPGFLILISTCPSAGTIARRLCYCKSSS